MLPPTPTPDPARMPTHPAGSERGLGVTFSQIREWFDAGGFDVWATDDGLFAAHPEAWLEFEIFKPAGNISKAVVHLDSHVDEREASLVALFIAIMTHGPDGDLPASEIRDAARLDEGEVRVVKYTRNRRMLFEQVQSAGTRITITAR